MSGISSVALFAALFATLLQSQLNIYVFLSPRWVLPRCTSMFNSEGRAVPMTVAARDEIMQTVVEMSGRGLRCICLAQVQCIYASVMGTV